MFSEHYGSHPTTFEIPHDGTVRMVFANGDILLEHRVEAGNVWRSASTRQAPIEDWVRLAISRQRAEGCQASFWLDVLRRMMSDNVKARAKAMISSPRAGSSWPKLGSAARVRMN